MKRVECCGCEGTGLYKDDNHHELGGWFVGDDEDLDIGSTDD